MKVKIKDLTKKQRIETLDALYTAASAVRGRDAVKRFLRDLLTESERVMLGRRILIAERLLAGATYDDIQKEFKSGVATISNVQRWLEDQIPGYEEALKGMEREFKKRKTKAEINKNFAAMKRKYPLHFMLFPWPKGYKPKGW